MSRRIPIPAEPDALVEYATTMAVVVTVVVAGALVYDRVRLPEPAQRRSQRFLLHRCERMGDLIDWPAARRRGDIEVDRVLGALGAVLVEQGLVPAPMTGMAAPAALSEEVTP